ncbi:hypothetical protein J2T08_006051 [Neorhizobium galegae]|uniref:hypothetical protein n=1 Tax=Neorhizobium galegae TaxID=399 RepID=UPI0027871E4F|nr:hypothetical protein [Neorhizobium galegae]
MLVGKELVNASLPGADVGEEFFQSLDAPVGEGRDTLFAAVMGMDHLAIVDIVGVAGDFLDEFKVFADQHSDVADHVDMRWPAQGGHLSAAASGGQVPRQQFRQS